MKAVKLPFWFFGGTLGKTQQKCCIQVGIFGLTWEETEDSKTNKQKRQLRNYCMKENFNSERIMWRNRDFILQQKVLVDYSPVALLKNTCRAWPRWGISVVWCHLCWVWCCCSISVHWPNCRSCKVTSVMGLGDQTDGFSFQGVWWWATVFDFSILAGKPFPFFFIHFMYLQGWELLATLFVLPVFMWGALHFPFDTEVSSHS